MCMNSFICFLIVLIFSGKMEYFQNRHIEHVKRMTGRQVDILIMCGAKATTTKLNCLLRKEGDRLTY